MVLRHRGRVAITVAILVLLGFFLPPFVNVNRYRGRIAKALESAMDRPVTVGSVALHIFPQPGFDLGNVTVGEDPAFGVEPMLHAEEVSASLRLTSLWRGRLEIAKLSFKYPSLNLVRNQQGRWNVEELLQNVSRIPTAPTTKSRPESRPRFPYIEAENGRINFKIGAEKKVYALSDADFALWLASETELRTRLAARMVRTDSYLSDTGILKFTGRFQRAWDLRDTPMEVSLSLRDAQLGQLTKFVDGNDPGWRGAVDFSMIATGTPAAMKISADGGVNDFRRYDIGSVERVHLEAHCYGQLAAATEHLSDVSCNMPMGNGVAFLTGELEGLPSPHAYSIKVAAKDVPAQSLVAIVRHAKRNIPDDLSAQGTINASLIGHKLAEDSFGNWDGNGSAKNVVLRSSLLKPELPVGEIGFAVQSVFAPEPGPKKRGRKAVLLAAQNPKVVGQPRLTVTPFSVAMGGAAPVKVSAWFTTDEYGLDVAGDSTIPRAMQVASATGLPVLDFNADGDARFDLQFGGKWAGFSAPKALGTIQVRDTEARMKGIAAPLKLASASISLGPDVVSATNVNATFVGTHVSLEGSLRMPRQCETVQNCPMEFDLHADQLATDDLNALLNPRAAKRPWYAILGSRPEPSILSNIKATGHISTNRLLLESTTVNRVSATAQLYNGDLKLNDVRGDVWGGKHTGEWELNFSGDQPVVSGSGKLESVSMTQVSAFTHDNWATGAANAVYKVKGNGASETVFFQTMKGDLAFDWRAGTLRHIALNGANTPLAFRHFSGFVEFENGRFNVTPQSKMSTARGIYEVSGTASQGRQINLTLRNGTHAYSVSGTLEKPKVTPAPLTEAQVSLKR